MENYYVPSVWMGLELLITRRNAAVMELFRTHPSQYRSSHYETKRTLIKSRCNQRKRANRLRHRVNALEAEIQQLRRSLQHNQDQLRLNRCPPQTVGSTCSDYSPPSNNPLLSDLPIAGHHFAAKMVALCINLVPQITIEGTPRAVFPQVSGAFLGPVCANCLISTA